MIDNHNNNGGEYYIQRIQELEDNNKKLQNKVNELEMLNNNLKNQLEYFQTKFLEVNLMDESKDISSCISEIYNSLNFDSSTALLGSDNSNIDEELQDQQQDEQLQDSQQQQPENQDEEENNSTFKPISISNESLDNLVSSPDTNHSTSQLTTSTITIGEKKSTWSTAVIPKTRSDSILQQNKGVTPHESVYSQRQISENQHTLFSQIKKKPIPPMPPGALFDSRRTKTDPIRNTPNIVVPPLRHHQSASTTVGAPRPSSPSVVQSNEEQQQQPTTATTGAVAQTHSEDDQSEIERLDDPNLLLVKNDNGVYIVRGGTLDKLVQRLSYEGSHDIDFSHAFLLTYRSFTTPSDLLDMLIQSYNAPVDENKFKNRKRIIKLRVANVIKKWLDRYFHDFQNDSDLLHKMDDFISSQILLDMESIGKNLKKLLTNERITPTPTFRELPPTSLIPKLLHQQNNNTPTSNTHIEFSFLDLEPLEIARQLTLIESDLYRKIQSKECLNQSWNKTDKEEKAPNIVAMIKRFNQVSSWVATEILQQDKLKDRVSVIKRFLLVADKCRELGNFNGLMEIISGLQNSSVHRLRKTWEKVESKPELKNLYDDLLAKTSSKQSYKEYRSMLHTAHPPCIPYVGVYLTDLTFVEDGNKNTLNSRDDLINFEKRRKISVIIREIQQYQQTPYNLNTEEHTLKYIKNLPTLSDASLYKLSLVCEPREIRNSVDSSSSSTNSSSRENSLTSSSSNPSTLKKEMSTTGLLSSFSKKD